jgi:hypothetical protein
LNPRTFMASPSTNVDRKLSGRGLREAIEMGYCRLADHRPERRC